MGLFASLVIHYNKSLNTKAQKQIETEIKNRQTKVVDSMVFKFIALQFFNRHQIFLNFQKK